MKISNSKKQLAKIISENGGWPLNAWWAAQDKDWRVSYFDDSEKPVRPAGKEEWWADGYIRLARIMAEKLLPLWHQTILSRDEYFHLYPAPDAAAEEPEHVWTNPPTIEQLAADYRAKLVIAQQAQEEADSHRCGAEAALEKLVAAGKALGLVLSVATPEPELVITDWRDLRVGDMVWCCEDEALAAGEYVVLEVEEPNYDGVRTVLVNGSSEGTYWIDSSAEWRFIRRPAKGANNA